MWRMKVNKTHFTMKRVIDKMKDFVDCFYIDILGWIVEKSYTRRRK